MERKQNQIQEQKVLQEELKSLRKDAEVYRQQQNSQIFFRTTADRAMAESKKTLDSLVDEYNSLERDAEQQSTEP